VRCALPYFPPPPFWMSGKDALRHIRQTDGCSLSKARNQLQSAIADGAVTARLPDPKDPSQMAIFPPWADDTPRGPGSSPMLSPGNRQFPPRKLWATASIRANGTVQFFSHATPWYRFDVERAHILRIWPAAPKHSKRTKARPVEDGIREAIAALWPGGIRPSVRTAARNEHIAKWLKANGYSVQSPSALVRAVQRVLKSRPN
jgi:hypothetical protein